MKRHRLLNILIVIGLLAVTAQANEIQADQAFNCPVGYMFFNGLCYLSSQQPSTVNCMNAVSTETTPIQKITTNPSIDPPATIKPEAIPEPKIRCPHGSIFMNGQCRQTFCPFGEFIAGRCLKIECPTGMVWRGHSCQEPEYLTTILEFENVFLSEVHESHGNVTHINTSNINNIVSTPTPTSTASPTTTPTTQITTTTSAPIVVVRPTFTTTQTPPVPLIRPECCTVHSPRLCKDYQRKWVCFNHIRKFCDKKVCAFPTMYLKTPQIVYKESLLIMPPHPPLKACRERGCDSTSTVDCSGCVKGEKQNCSPHCYYYFCPENTCGYMDLRDFCRIYPNHPFGCNQDEGCIWGWCGGENTPTQ